MPKKSIGEWMNDPLAEKIAQVAYAAIQEWCVVTKQEFNVPWAHLSPDYQNHIKVVVARAFTAMEVPTAKELHARCLAEGINAGWTHGDHVDRKKKTHPDILPWEKLSFDQRMKDFLFSNILRAFIEG